MNDSPRYRLLLPSGRGVELQNLDFTQVDAVEIAVAKMRGDEGTAPRGFGSSVEYQKAVALEGIRLMVKGASQAKLTSPEDLLTAPFTSYGPGQLEDDNVLKSLFSAKDMVVLRNRFATEHDVTMPELSGVMEKKVDVLSA